MPPDPLLLQTIIDVGRALPQVTNVGMSGDERDLYYLIDYLTFAVHRTYPAILCKEGCAMCCYTSGVPRTSQAEWDRIRAHLEGLDPAPRERVLARAEAAYRAVLPALQEESAGLGSLYQGGGRSADLKAKLSSMACPFLEQNRCSIYEVRPAICRGYGYFTIRLGGEDPSLFTCQPAADDMIARMRAAGEETWMLPAWNKFADRVMDVNAPGAAVKFLPQWLLEWADAAGHHVQPVAELPPPPPPPFAV